MHAIRGRRRARRILIMLGLLAGTAAWSAAGAQAFVFRLSVGAAPYSRPLASDFLGLALEYSSIPGLAGTDPQAVDPVLVQLIRNLVPHGQTVLRIGGQSTDRTWWPVPGTSQPLGVTYALTPAWTASARALAQATGARLILGVGLEANRPRIDAVEAAQLLSGIGRQYVDALEIGNEPELYTVVPWYRKQARAQIPWYSSAGRPVFARPSGYAYPAFASEFRRVLRVLPGVPIAGPNTGVLSWLDAFGGQFVSRRSRVRMVTWHDYGLNACVTDPRSPVYPTVPNLLSTVASRDSIGDIASAVALAHRSRATLRIDEMGTVSCNGRAGVSDTMASALWVMDALFTIAAHGVDGVNLHTYPNSVNGLFDFTRSQGTWQAAVHPLYYGALMFAQAAPAGSRLLPIVSASQARLRAWATRTPDGRIRVLLINDSLASSALAVVRTPVAPGPATVERLRAGSPYARDGLSLGGQTFGPATTTGLLAPPAAEVAAPRAGRYEVTLPAGTAALVTLPPPGPAGG